MCSASDQTACIKEVMENTELNLMDVVLEESKVTNVFLAPSTVQQIALQ